jgi:hypothetical protein
VAFSDGSAASGEYRRGVGRAVKPSVSRSFRFDRIYPEAYAVAYVTEATFYTPSISAAGTVGIGAVWTEIFDNHSAANSGQGYERQKPTPHSVPSSRCRRASCLGG